MPADNSKERTPQSILRERTQLRKPVKVGFHIALVGNLRRLWFATSVVALASLIGMCNWRGTTGKKAFAAVLTASLVVLACGTIYEVFAAWKAKRWQFGLRTWFAIVGFAGILFAIPANHYVVRRRQSQLMPAINELGGSASIRRRYYHDRQLYSLWLMVIGQTDLFADFQGASIDESALRGLSTHPARSALTKLWLDRSNITDVSLAYAASFPNLRELSFCGCNVSDRGLQALRNAPSLESICCRETPTISADGVRELKQHKPLLLVYRLQTLDPE